MRFESTVLTKPSNIEEDSLHKTYAHCEGEGEYKAAENENEQEELEEDGAFLNSTTII